MKCFTSQEFLDHDFKMPLFLAAPAIPLGGDVLVHGKRGAGKTQYALTLAEAVLYGSSFLGTYACSQQPVAYLQLDMPARLQQERMQKFGLVHDDFHILTSDSRINVLLDAVKKPDWVSYLRSLDAGLVIVDTLRKCHPLDENDSDTPVQVYGAWRDIVGPKATMCYIHHDRKSFEGQNLDESSRGSGAWLDEVDTAIHLMTRAKKLAKMSFTKARTMEIPEPMAIRLNPETLKVETDGMNEVDAWIDKAKREQKLTKTEIVDYCTNPENFRDKETLHRATVYRRLEGYPK